MNREKELGRIRFMLGEHAEVLDRACSTMEHVMSEDEFSDFLASINCSDGDSVAEFRRLFIESGQLQAAA